MQKIKPDIICVWPIAFDYPLWRHVVTKNRHYFDKVIISFTYNNLDRDFRQFLKNTHPDFTLVDTGNNQSPYWYHSAIIEALNNSHSDWILFSEQDFIYDDNFIKNLLEKTLINNLDFACLVEGSNRKHFGCFLIKKSLILQTTQFFDQVMNLDCFDRFTIECSQLTKKWMTLEELGFVRGLNYDHLNGLTHNYYLFTQKIFNLITGKDKFIKYNKNSIEANIIQNPEWQEIMKGVEQWNAI